MGKKHFILVLLLTLFLAGFQILPKKRPVHLFNGKTFAGWEGDTIGTWKIKEGAIVGGSLTEIVPHNNFSAQLNRTGILY